MQGKSNIAFLLIALTSLGLMSSDIYAPAQPFLQNFFGVSEGRLQSLMSIFFIGTIFSSLTAGTLSDIYGRKPCVLLALFAMVSANTLLIFSNSFVCFQIARFVQGLSAGALSVISFAVIQDCSKNPNFTHKFFSYIGVILIFVPILSPLLGSFILEQYGWRYIFYALFTLSIVSFFISLIFMHETNEQLQPSFNTKYLLHAASNTFKTPRFIDYLLIYPLLSVGYWIFITDSAFVFKNTFSLTVLNYKYLISLIVFMFAAGNIISRFAIKHVPGEILVRTGILISIVGILVLVAQQYNYNLALYMIGNMSLMFGIGLVFAPATFLTLSAVKNNKGMSATIRSGSNMIASWLGATTAQFVPLNQINSVVLGCAIFAMFLAFKKQVIEPQVE